MSRILISSGPTRQYLDPVRYLTNASSGQMGMRLAEAALQAGHEVLIVSGPVDVTYPAGASVTPVTTTDEMLDACKELFPACDGMIGAAAPCDYRPVQVADQKIRKTGEPLTIQLVETPDVVATLGQMKRPSQWVVGFALETEDAHFRAVTKLQKKCCDLVVVNGPQAISAEDNSVALIDTSGRVVARYRGGKAEVAQAILAEIQQRLVGGQARASRPV